ncbi:MAG: HIT family hydrolase [Planctomycetaceae bacterium]|nr:HIT family hydrolase [Planctomycetaceae bacterium]
MSESSPLHEQLWAPWRLAYIVTTDDKPKHDCFLCHYQGEENDLENLVISRGEQTISVLNRFPYNNGHLLVAPNHHKAGLDELTEDELVGCMQEVQRLTAILKTVMNPDGFNIGLNLGRVAGAGLPGHLHWHIVPRWNGDTNFMPVLADVKVIPQSLNALWELLNVEMSRN